MAGSLSFNSTRNADIYLHTALVESFQESSASGRKLHVTAFHSYLEKATFNKTHTSPQKITCRIRVVPYIQHNTSARTSLCTCSKSRNVRNVETCSKLCTFVTDTAPCLHYMQRLDMGYAGKQIAIARQVQNKTKNLFQSQVLSDSLFWKFPQHGQP